MSRSTKISTVGFALMLALGACATGESTKAGGEAPPIVLEIGTDDHPGKPASDQIEEFARRVEELSGGSIQMKPVFHAAGDGQDWDQRVARMVVGGELDMGNIPARAWDTEGVNSLRALNAPFLITDDELVSEVITSDISDDLMSGLEDIGIVGMALLPEGLRHPFGFEQPLLSPEDYEGKVMRTPTSATTKAMFEALGATVTDGDADAFEHAGMESEYVLDPTGTATGNITFYPKVNSLVINADVYAGLSDEQRDLLRQAGEDTQSWVIENLATDANAAATFCEEGQAVVLAEAANLAAMESATAPVYTWLEEDELTRSLIASIREMKASVDVAAPPAVPCGELPEELVTGDFVRTPLDGIYRFEVTEDQLRAAGVDEADIRGVTGVYTVTFSNGNVSFVQTGPYPESNAEDSADHFVVEGDQLTVVWPDGRTQVLKWSQNSAGDLDLEVVSSAWPEEDEAYTAQPWIRIGDAESPMLPDGVYRADVRLEDVEAIGNNNDDGWTGTWTLTLSNGTYALTCAILDIPSRDCGNSGGIDEVLEAGYARVDGNHVVFVYDSELHSMLSGCQLPCSPLPSYQVEWSLDGDNLRFSDMQAQGGGRGGLEKVLAPWIKIGDVTQ